MSKEASPMFIEKKFNKKNFLTGCLLAAGVMGAQVMSPVYAQETADDTVELEEIIVTAARREQSIQDVSGVVQSFNAEELRKGGVESFKDLQIAIPGLNISQQEGNVDIFIRGVGSANNTELGDPGAAPHINGVYIPRPRGLGGQFYDVERIEINKGPQGTLYGRNALGGTLNLITKKPSLDGEYDGYIQADVQSRGGFGVEGAVNIPVSSSSAFRVAGFYKEADAGFSNAGVESLEEAGISEDFGARVSFTSQINNRLSLNVIADYSEEGGTGFPGSNVLPALEAANTPDAVAARGGEELTTEDFDLRDVFYRGTQGDLDSESFGILANLKYDFDAFSLEGSLSYRGVRFNQVNAANDGVVFEGNDFQEDNFGSVYWETNSDAIIGEVRILSNGDGPLQWSAGLFGFDESQEVAFLSVVDQGVGFSGFESTQPNVDGQSFAIFGDLSYELNDKTRLFGGLRYTDEEKSRLGGVLGGFGVVNGFEAFDCCSPARFGTEGFVPAGLNRTTFDAPAIALPSPNTGNQTPEQRLQAAQLILDAIGVSGDRDDLGPGLQAILNGNTPNGNAPCTPTADVVCPANGFFSFQNIDSFQAASNGSFEDDFVDWRLGVEYDVNDSQMIYAKISTGTKSGGFNDNNRFTGIATPFDTEEVLVYEIGSRWNFTAFDNPGLLNVTAFYYDYSDQVFQSLETVGGSDNDIGMGDDAGTSLLNSNVSDSNIIGVEFESRFLFPSNVSLDLFATILQSEIESGVVSDARFADFNRAVPNPTVDLSRNDLPLVSDWEVTARLSQQIEFANGSFDWQVLAKYRDDYFLTQFNNLDINDPDFGVMSALELGHDSLQEGYATVNIGFGYTVGDGKYRIEAFGQNIFDETASQKAIVDPGINLRFLNDARTWGVRGIARF